MNLIRRLITLTSNRTLGASLTRPPFTPSLIHSFTHSLIHSFTHCLCLCFALLLVSSVSAQDVPTRRGSRNRKSTRLNSSHVKNSYAVFCLKKNNCRCVRLM